MEQMIGLDEKFQELRAEREMLLTSNRSLAEDSLTRRPRLCSGKFQLAQKYGELSHLAAACWEKQSQLEALVGNTGCRQLRASCRSRRCTLRSTQRSGLESASFPTLVGSVLQKQGARIWTELKCWLHQPVCFCRLIVFPSQELLQRFMEASLSLEDFLDSFQSSRITYHIHRAKAEKIQEVSEARQQLETSKEAAESQTSEEKKNEEQPQVSQIPNGFLAQGPLRVFQVRYGLRPAILLPQSSLCPGSWRAAAQTGSPPPEGQTGHSLSHTSPPPGHGAAVGLRLIGQVPGGWPASGRALRLQQLYRLSPQQTEPPLR
ncbi:unnamed protein product [Tetraodon nigroviridis]|uniref:(spotted green pufferfish) hypothetical protein n=1 Tax=Tetraodon nigroviridis TaxID=99883 RepID=Q4T757_TETNG|nr:unnamed protein product [Tetraodon nigroviridis]